VGQFCDSDKYSFAISTASVFNRLPDNIREVLGSQPSLNSFGGNGGLDITAPLYIRRRYLQDLYRFFRLNDHRGAFFDPFVINLGNVLFCNDIFDAKLHTQAIRVSHFLLHRGMLEVAYRVMKRYFDASFFDDLLLMGKLMMKLGLYSDATTYYEKAIRMRPDDERAIMGYAMVLFKSERYKEAAVQFKRLMDMHPERNAYALNHAISLINANELEEGIQFLYAQYYKNEDDINTKRALAWGLLCQKKLDRAEKLYQEILADAACNEGDYLNSGYCAWFLGHRQEAIRIFKEHVKNLHGNIVNDTRLFDLYGISHVERQMIEDIYLS
jgi:tetratricopeptide (TPR) repeat protein